MVGIIKNVLATDHALAHRFANLRYSTSARSPTLDDAKRLESFLLTELNVIESNEMVEEGMKESSWHLQQVPGQIRALQGGKGTSSASGGQEAGPQGDKKGLCFGFVKGNCKFGYRCKFSHDGQSKEQKVKERDAKKSRAPCTLSFLLRKDVSKGTGAHTSTRK